MRVLLVGKGAREHALAWALSKSSAVEHLMCVPGNPGIAKLAECVDGREDDVSGLVETAMAAQPDLVVAGPEAPLVAGLTDALAVGGIPVFGPSAHGAMLEGSKSFAKDLMIKTGIPTASADVFGDLDSALAAVGRTAGPVVIKADGLAAGKGVIVAEDRAEAEAAVRELMEVRRFGDAGDSILIEQQLTGPELSVLAFCDGERFLTMPAAQDFKRAYDQDLGPNTGGMGAYSPVPLGDEGLMDEVHSKVFDPLFRALREQGIAYVGVIYAGLMLTPEGPKVIEFNCRFGDPETQALIPRADFDLAEVMLACVEGRLDQVKVAWRDEACVSVVVASGDYPETSDIGFAISGLDEAESVTGIPVFHAATALKDGQLVTDGGRVATISAVGPDIASARETAYRGVEKVRFETMRYRSDIAKLPQEVNA